jgi:hypothetical protein
LKTAITNTVGEGVPIGGWNAEPGTPTDELVDMAFGRVPITGSIGMWGSGTVGANGDEQDNFSFLPWYRTNNAGSAYVGGCLAVYRGLRFLISLDRHNPPPAFNLTRIPGWKGAEFLRPFRGIDAPGPNLAIQISWSWS